MYLFIFNGIYAVIAFTKEEAKEKLVPYLAFGHGWYLDSDAECKSEQGHLIVEQFPINDGVIILSEKLCKKE